MRLLVCSSMKDAYSTFDQSKVFPWITIVGSVDTADELIDILMTESIDVAVAGCRWVDEWQRANVMADKAGIELPPLVVATSYLTGALCLECAAIPVADLIDLREGFSSAADRMLLASKGFRAQDSNEVVPSRWIRGHEYVKDAIRDEFDLLIMRRLLDGDTNSEIAAHVHLSYQTVNNRISQMIHRTGSSNRTRLALMFRRPCSARAPKASLKQLAQTR